jgi:hypothetical protein
VVDLQAELHGFHGPLLAYDVGEGFQVFGGAEGKHDRVAGFPEIGRSKFFKHGVASFSDSLTVMGEIFSSVKKHANSLHRLKSNYTFFVFHIFSGIFELPRTHMFPQVLEKRKEGQVEFFDKIL